MKSKFKLRKISWALFAIALVLSVSSCEEPEAMEVQEPFVESERAGPIGESGSAQTANKLTYKGNNRWEGTWATIKITFSGCSPEELANGTTCAFYGLSATGGSLLYTDFSLYEGVLSLSFWGTNYVTLYRPKFTEDYHGGADIYYDPVGPPYDDGGKVESFSHGIFLNGTATVEDFPFVIIFINDEPYLVHPDYDDGGCPGCPDADDLVI